MHCFVGLTFSAWQPFHLARHIIKMAVVERCVNIPEPARIPCLFARTMSEVGFMVFLHRGGVKQQ